MTHVFAAGDPYLGSDAVVGVKQSLVEVQLDGETVAGLDFDSVLAPA